MLFWMATYFALVEQVAMVLKSPTVSTDTAVMRGRYEPGVHMINNANPYQGVTITEGHVKYPVIFEPLQNVLTSHSTYMLLLLLISLHTWSTFNSLKGI